MEAVSISLNNNNFETYMPSITKLIIVSDAEENKFILFSLGGDIKSFIVKFLLI